MSFFVSSPTGHPKEDIAEKQCLFFVRNPTTQKKTSLKGNVFFCEKSHHPKEDIAERQCLFFVSNPTTQRKDIAEKQCLFL